MKQILVREVERPVPTFNRLPTKFEKQHRDKDEVQLVVALALIVLPVAVVVWEVL